MFIINPWMFFRIIIYIPQYISNGNETSIYHNDISTNQEKYQYHKFHHFHEVKFQAKSEGVSKKTNSFFKLGWQLLVEPKDGFYSSIEIQGSGARRTLLCIALKYISETNNN